MNIFLKNVDITNSINTNTKISDDKKELADNQKAVDFKHFPPTSVDLPGKDRVVFHNDSFLNRNVGDN